MTKARKAAKGERTMKFMTRKIFVAMHSRRKFASLKKSMPQMKKLQPAIANGNIEKMKPNKGQTTTSFWSLFNGGMKLKNMIYQKSEKIKRLLQKASQEYANKNGCSKGICNPGVTLRSCWLEFLEFEIRIRCFQVVWIILLIKMQNETICDNPQSKRGRNCYRFDRSVHV